MTQILSSGLVYVPWEESTFRTLGTKAAEACRAEAERVSSFNTEGAASFIHGWLVRNGAPMSGETLVNAAKEHSYRPHDDRAFGSVFQMLVRRGKIRCVGYGERTKGHGTSGLRIWAAV